MRDVVRRECRRMVGCYPELEEEVRWWLEHVMTKWEMLTQLRTKSRNKLNNRQDAVYQDSELEVKCLHHLLREMEAWIDPDLGVEPPGQREEDGGVPGPPDRHRVPRPDSEAGGGSL